MLQTQFWWAARWRKFKLSTILQGNLKKPTIVSFVNFISYISHWEMWKTPALRNICLIIFVVLFNLIVKSTYPNLIIFCYYYQDSFFPDSKIFNLFFVLLYRKHLNAFSKAMPLWKLTWFIYVSCLFTNNTDPAVISFCLVRKYTVLTLSKSLKMFWSPNELETSTNNS